MRNSLLFLIALSFIGCRARRPEFKAEEMISKRLEIIDRKVDVNIKGGESQAAFLLNKKTGSLDKLSSNSNDIAGEPEATLDTNGVLRVKCPCKDRKEAVVVSDTKEKTTQKESVQKKIYIPEPTRWQWAQIYAGRALLGCLVLFILWILIKKRNKFI